MANLGSLESRIFKTAAATYELLERFERSGDFESSYRNTYKEYWGNAHRKESNEFKNIAERLFWASLIVGDIEEEYGIGGDKIDKSAKQLFLNHEFERLEDGQLLFLEEKLGGAEYYSHRFFIRGVVDKWSYENTGGVYYRDFSNDPLQGDVWLGESIPGGINLVVFVPSIKFFKEDIAGKILGNREDVRDDLSRTDIKEYVANIAAKSVLLHEKRHLIDYLMNVEPIREWEEIPSVLYETSSGLQYSPEEVIKKGFYNRGPNNEHEKEILHEILEKIGRENFAFFSYIFSLSVKKAKKNAFNLLEEMNKKGMFDVS